MIGARVGPYEVVARLGEGGMGEVYRATDSRLKRDVAIKVLPAAFTADRERLARFEREAQLLAQLQHPNVASIYGLEEASGTRALVMELVDGEELASRIARGPLPLDEALGIARQIAEALEAAHERGIVHRDLKPANVKVRSDGAVKVLDFGLAKAMEPAAAGADVARSPTLLNSPTLSAAHGTRMGVILGTAAYMSPEQARGGAVDERADVWAFGVVLFEMLAGRSLFAGETVSDTLAGVLKTDIDFAQLPPSVPPAVRRLLRHCLERNPKNRLHDVADARILLADAAGEAGDETTVAPPSGVAAPRSMARRWGPWAAGLLLGALAGALVGRTLLAPPPAEPPTLVPLTYSGKDLWPVASPDGKTLAFVSTRDGGSRIWLKQLATGEEVAITAGPADAGVSFSPDGASLLFLRGATSPFGLYRVSAVGGTPRRIADGVASAAAWSPDGRRIALTRAATAGGLPDTLVTVAADGGDERELARVTDVTIFNLRWSPDGSRIGAWTLLRTNFAARQSIIEFDAATGERHTLYEPAAGALINGWAWSGADAVVFAEVTSQSGSAGTRLRRIARGAASATTLLSLRQPSSWLDVAGPGRIVIDQASPTQNLGDWPLAGPHAGVEPAAAAAPANWWTRGASVDRQPVFSPDGTRLVFNSDRGGNLDIWELELANGALRRLTVDAADDWDPAYTPDGGQLLWSSNRSGNFEIWSAASDGSGMRKVTADGVDAENPTATADGEWIVYASANPARSGIWKIHPDGTGAERLAAGSHGVPELSPDGRWVSFVDLDTSRVRVVALADGAEVFALDMPLAVVPNLQVGRARWVPGSSTLIWLDHDPEARSWRLASQEIAPGRDTRATRRVLIEGSPDALPESFAISPDGSRIVVSVTQTRSELLMVSGLAGVTR